MSEFSESYHLRASSRLDAIGLLRTAGLKGFVFPAVDGWVTFVVEGEPFRANQNVISANQGPLVHWIFGQDHGWEFAVYRGSKQVLKYGCSWEDEVEIEGRVSQSDLERDLGMSLPLLAGEAGADVFYPKAMEDVIAGQPAYAFAKGLGLTYYRWLSYNYLASDLAHGDPLPAGVQAIG